MAYNGTEFEKIMFYIYVLYIIHMYVYTYIKLNHIYTCDTHCTICIYTNIYTHIYVYIYTCILIYVYKSGSVCCNLETSTVVL